MGRGAIVSLALLTGCFYPRRSSVVVHDVAYLGDALATLFGVGTIAANTPSSEQHDFNNALGASALAFGIAGFVLNYEIGNTP